MSFINKGLIIGLLIGLVSGASLVYLVSPRYNFESLEERIGESENTLAGLSARLEDYTMATSPFTGSMSPGIEAFTDYYLRIEGIQGESKALNHENWIEFDSYSWGMHRAADTMSPELGDLVITKCLDKASPKLYEACASGERIREAIIDVVVEEQTFMVIKLEDVRISSVESSSDGGGSSMSDRPIESVSLNYQKIKWTYTVREDSVLTDEVVEAGWDLKLNKAYR